MGHLTYNHSGDASVTNTPQCFDMQTYIRLWHKNLVGACIWTFSKEQIVFKRATKLKPKIISVSATKIGENTAIILNCYFPNRFTLWHIKLSRYRKSSLLLIYRMHVFLSSLEVQKIVIQNNYTTSLFYSFWKERTPKPSKQQLQKYFSPLCMLLLQLALINGFCSMW